MMEFFRECFLTINLPVTIMLLVVLGYWIMVIVGVIGLDLFDFDFDGDWDFDLDGDFDADVDAGGGWGWFFDFLHLSDVPVVIVGSFFVVFMWITVVLSNHYLNSFNSAIVMAYWLIPNILLSLLATRFAVMPLTTLFQHDHPTEINRDNMIGSVGVVTSSKVTPEFGRIEIQQQGPPLIFNVYTQQGKQLNQGDAARIVSYNPVDNTFLVELAKWEKS